MAALRSAALIQAEQILSELELKQPGVVTALREDALTTLAGWSEITVEMVEEIHGSDCSIAGQYLDETTPPTLLVARSMSHRRQQFSVLHELGHHLQRNSFALLRALSEAGGNDPVALEEAACEIFASRVLLPDTVVEPIIGPRGPSAHDVVRLYQAAPKASRTACCIRAAGRLQAPGAVFLLTLSGEVFFTFGHGMPPPAKGTDQSATPLIAAALRNHGRAQRMTRINYRDGSTSDDLYGDCEPIDGLLVAVVIRDRAAWQAFAPPRPSTSRRPNTRWTCTYCNDEFDTFDALRCTRCSDPLCPAGHCSCTAARERTCMQCFLVRTAAQFAGNSTVCRDCLE